VIEARRTAGAIKGVFYFRSLDDPTCGTGRSGHRDIPFRAELVG